jgi:sodium/bile acid cotransporter 7
MNLKNLFLPMGLVVAVIISLAFPQLGMAAQRLDLTKESVMTIFLINGYQSKVRFSDFTPSFLTSFIFLAISALILSPWMASALGAWLDLPSSLLLGLIVMSAMPTTLSSGIVVSGVARGQASWALMFTMGLSLLGIFTVPCMLSLLIQDHNVMASPWPLLYKLICMVLIPFLVGAIIRRWVDLSQFKLIFSYLPSTCVIYVVWLSLSASASLLLEMGGTTFCLALGTAVLIHVILLIWHYGLAKVLKLELAQTKTLTFIGAQKTLPIAISTLSALLGADMGLSLTICLIFHFSQLLIDSSLAGFWSQASEHK